MPEFSQRLSLGSKSRTKIAEYLLEIDDPDAAGRFSGTGGGGQGMAAKMLGVDQYCHTGILLGFVDPGLSGSALPVQNAMTLTADADLKDSRIKITLDSFYVQSFPGVGTHEILCEFTGKNQIRGEAEEMRFALTTTANDGSSAAVSGAPIFLGVSVGRNGIAFEGRTVNVKSGVDELLIETLGNDTFRNGLSLLTTMQPALKPFVGLAGSVVKAIASRTRNCQVYSFKLGLDFAGGSTSARLRCGSYVVVQTDAANWDWSRVRWNADSQRLIEASSGSGVEYNYMIFGVSHFEDQDRTSATVASFGS